MHKTIIFCMTMILITIIYGCSEHPVQPLSENSGSTQEVFAGKLAITDEIIFDQGPDTGKTGAYLHNFIRKENCAESFSFDKNTKISGIIVYTREISNYVHIKILSDIKGQPREYLYEENTAPDSWVIDPTGRKVPQYEMTVYLSTPFKAMANTTYWIGVSGNDKDIWQYTVYAPGDGRTAIFKETKFVGTAEGDMMFKLVGEDKHGNNVLDADAGDDQTIYTDQTSVLVTLDGSDSRGHKLEYEWARKEKGRWKVFSTEVSPVIKLKRDTYIFKLTVTDNKGNTDTDTVTVKVMKAPSQKLTINVITPVIWPPNHKMVLAVEVSPIKIVKSVNVKCNEHKDGTGDGDTAPDWEIISNKKAGTYEVYLRAERSGLGDGRIYSITASDGKNKETTTVTVPGSMGSGKK